MNGAFRFLRNRLNKSTQKHTKRPTQLICYTDNNNGNDDKVIC